MPDEKVSERVIVLFIKTPVMIQSSDTEKKFSPKEMRIG